MNIVALTPTGEPAGFTTVPGKKYSYQRGDGRTGADRAPDGGIGTDAEGRDHARQDAATSAKVSSKARSRWLKRPGDAIAKTRAAAGDQHRQDRHRGAGAADGVLLEILVPEGTTVAAGALLATIGVPGESPATAPAHQTRRHRRRPPSAFTEVAAPSDAPSRPNGAAGRTFISPVVAAHVG